jgi:dihydropteroate synthase
MQQVYHINCKGRLLVINGPAVMGIINATPDSFYEGHLLQGIEGMLQLAIQMVAEGAVFLDIGGQSTRPGSEPLSPAAEADRVLPLIEAIQKHLPQALLSIDTYHSSVARQAVMAGAAMVNDISGGQLDAAMLATVAALKVPYVCMHIQGTPNTMQHNPQYSNVTREVLDYFIAKTTDCTKAGIMDVLIDPGFGFGKTIAHNYELLRNLNSLQMLQKPVLVGVSRKSMIYKTLGITAAEALNGTTALHTLALQNGATILRVHDVKPAMEAVQLYKAYQGIP